LNSRSEKPTDTKKYADMIGVPQQELSSRLKDIRDMRSVPAFSHHCLT